jgi:hypothetical protein
MHRAPDEDSRHPLPDQLLQTLRLVAEKLADD